MHSFSFKTAMNVGYCGMQRRKSRLRHVIAAPACRYFSKSRIYRIYQIAVRGKPAIGDGVLWTTLCKRGEAERSLETAAAGAVSLGGSVVASHHKWGHGTLDTHDAPLFAAAAVFFRRSRLFFREAAFFSGGEGCEWRAQRATVGVSGDKAENAFSGFIPLVVQRKGFSPHIPASRLFVLFHPSKPTYPTKSSIPPKSRIYRSVSRPTRFRANR